MHPTPWVIDKAVTYLIEKPQIFRFLTASGRDLIEMIGGQSMFSLVETCN